MGSELDKLHQESNIAFEQILKSVNSLNKIESHISQVKDEYSRVINIAGQAGYILDNIDKEFKDKTKLTSNDIILLFLCTAIQCARQYLFPNDSLRFKDDFDENGKVKTPSNKKGDEFMKNTIGKMTKPEWNEVLFQGVPYDIFHKGPHVHDIGLSGTTHRYRTLGHDPILGWIFGTANIMTISLTKYNLETFRVNIKENYVSYHYPHGWIGMLDKAAHYASIDKKLLAASVARQAIHFGSDMFTKQGLPIPFISSINNDLAKDMLTKWNIDTWSVVKGTGLSALINNLIYCIHQLFYKEEKDGARNIYEVRTRKILSYSNTIATSSNILVSAITENGKLLDVGGMTVTLYRLISDYKFIHDIKEEFLRKNFHDLVVGDEYEFVKEYNNA